MTLITSKVICQFSPQQEKNHIEDTLHVRPSPHWEHWIELA